MAKIKKSQDGGKLNRLGPAPLSRPKEKPVPIPPPAFPKKSTKPIMKAKSGKSFPDLNKDGKVTKADILKGRGVIAKNGKPVKKAFLGAALPLAMKALPMLGGMLGGLLGGKNGKTVKKSKSGSTIKKTGMHKMPNGSMMKNSKMKMGGAVKKAQSGDYLDAGELIPKAGPMVKTKVKERSPDGNYVTKTVTRTRKGATTKSSKTRRTLQGYLDGAPRVNELKRNGGKMKTCKGGC